MHERPYFPGPGISWKAQKEQVNITFSSNFYLKKDRFSPHCKSQNQNFLVATNKNFSVISKYHISINFLPPKKDRISHHGKVQNKNFSVTSKYHLSINFLSQKDRIFHPPKVQNKNISVIRKYHLSTNFLSQKRPYFTFSKSSKQELFTNQYIYFHQVFGSKKTVCIIPEKFKTRSPQQSVRISISVLEKISYRFCFAFEDWHIAFSFLKTPCKLLLSSNFLR